MIHELAQLCNRAAVFRDRAHAGELLAGMLEELRGSDTVVLAIPAGGVPVAVVIAERLALSLDVAVGSKITLPWNREAGYGAVAFDGSVRLNDELIAALALGQGVAQEGIAQTREKVRNRLEPLRGDRPWAELARRAAVIVDDGLATGYTLLAAAEAVRRYRPQRLLVAVPTGHAEAVERLAAVVDALYCANVREAVRFAVADAYVDWYDVDESSAAYMLKHDWQRTEHDGREP